MKLSVLMLAYNHERYISEALDGVIRQQTDFDYEIVIGEDCSTDDTRNILLGYRERYPDRIRLLLPEKNLGMMGNFIQTFEACRGEYIALLEGDDFWTSPVKLQRQVDFLDSRPECAECFHNVEIAVEGGSEENRLFFKAKAKPLFTLKDVVRCNVIPTCATMLRAAALPRFPEWFASMPMGDWPLHVLLAERGDLGYLPETMAVYRVHGGGLWSGTSRLSIIEKSLRAADVINRHLDFRFDRVMTKAMAGWQREAAALLLEQGANREALRRAWSAAVFAPLRSCRFLAETAIKVAFRRAQEALRGTAAQP